jgi:antirestriction protein ArdC
MLCGVAGISPPTIDASAAYVDHWLGQLRGDKRLVVSAAGRAQRACDFILGRRFADEIEGDESMPPAS